MKLNEAKEGSQGTVRVVSGTSGFLRRISAVGITPGSRFAVVQNIRHYPMLLSIRNTLLAIDPTDCGQIEVEVM